MPHPSAGLRVGMLFSSRWLLLTRTPQTATTSQGASRCIRYENHPENECDNNTGDQDGYFPSRAYLLKHKKTVPWFTRKIRHRRSPIPSFRMKQAEFFFRFRSCDRRFRSGRKCVGLRRETSAPSRAFGGMKSLFFFSFCLLVSYF
jgi:hypothetical protein